MSQTARRPAQTRKSGWSPERRARQAARIRLWAPWARSTGPRTTAGKTKSARNSWKHGDRSYHMRLMSKALSAQSRFSRGVNSYISARNQNTANELLDTWGRSLFLEGFLASAMLDYALRAAGFTQKWRYHPYLPRNFHQNR